MILLQRNFPAKVELNPDQTSNADENGLFWRVLPTRTLVNTRKDTAPGRKTSKESHVCVNYAYVMLPGVLSSIVPSPSASVSLLLYSYPMIPCTT
jgi:hypothetical protein